MYIDHFMIAASSRLRLTGSCSFTVRIEDLRFKTDDQLNEK